MFRRKLYSLKLVIGLISLNEHGPNHKDSFLLEVSGDWFDNCKLQIKTMKMKGNLNATKFK
jgi:hypothetical protein